LYFFRGFLFNYHSGTDAQYIHRYITGSCSGGSGHVVAVLRKDLLLGLPVSVTRSNRTFVCFKRPAGRRVNSAKRKTTVRSHNDVTRSCAPAAVVPESLLPLAPPPPHARAIRMCRRRQAAAAGAHRRTPHRTH